MVGTGCEGPPVLLVYGGVPSLAVARAGSPGFGDRFETAFRIPAVVDWAARYGEICCDDPVGIDRPTHLMPVRRAASSKENIFFL